MNAGDILDRIIRANYKFLFWSAVFAVIAFIGFQATLFGIAQTLPDWLPFPN